MVLTSRPVVTMAGIDQSVEGRMAEWLRPRVFIAENGLNIRRISVGSKSCPSRKSIGWAVGDKNTSRRYYGRRKPIILQRAGWPSGVFIAENGLIIHQISVGSKSCPSRKSIG